jgi:GNAT superfamily N-acetyltransferase
VRHAYSVTIRDLRPEDGRRILRFVLMAAFRPGDKPPPGAPELPHVRRWWKQWGEELGVGWEEDGELIGAAWARHVEPVIARDEATGEPLAEVIVSVVPAARGRGIGRGLVEGLLVRARAAGCAGLSLTVSERNRIALSLYERVGFTHGGHAPAEGHLTMVWRPGQAASQGETAARR